MMSFKEFKASVSTSKVAGPQQQQSTTSTSKHLTTDITKESTTMSSPTPSTSSTTTSSSNQEPTSMKMGKLFGFIDDTYRDIRRIHSGLHKDVYNTQLMQTINKYKNGCNKIFEDVIESHDMSKKLAQNIVRTIDIFKELCTSLTDLEEYQHRVCELMAIFIACELRLSVDSTIQDQILIGQRIVFIMRRHLVQEVEEETRYNILKTLVYLPRLFNARDIMCAIFGQFIPMKPVSDVNVLPDKLYMLYIIVFYRWMMMQKDDDDKLLIVNFAESFMKPSVTLCTNQLYATHLPRYTTHSTATRTILNNMKFYRDIRNASIIDNALKKIGSIVDLCDDDEEDADLIILDSPNSTEFAEIFSAVQLETLGDSMSNIKLEEKTLVDTVDLTEEEEESTNPSNTIRDRHEKWLNNFQQLAKQFRESQLIMERQQNSQLISNNQTEPIICLDSDSENEDEELTAAANASASKTQEITKNTEKSSDLSEDLFVDNYPPTVTPINCSTDLESSDVEDDDDATKLSSRFLSGTIRTYQAKRMHQIESQANTETAYRRDSIHISSTPPDRLDDDEYSDNQDDEGTDVQDEHDQEEDEAETFPPITLQKPRPRGPYPTYNSMQNNKIVFSQSITRLPYDKVQQQNQRTQQSDVKSPKKQKKKVHFNTSPVGPTVVQNKPLKPALQQSKYKASDAPDYFHLRGFERLTTTAPSTTGSTSTCGSASTTLSLNKQQEQQDTIWVHKFNKTKISTTNQPTVSNIIVSTQKTAELTSENCNENQYNESKKREIKRSFKLNHNNNNNKCLKNLSVFNQKYLFKQKSFKNVKINLKKLKLNKDISLTNSKSSFNIEDQPPPLYTALNLLDNNTTTYLNYKQTETCQLKTKLIDTITNASNNLKNNVNAMDDDAIFKKPLPVTRKFVKSPKPIKIHKVVSLRSQPFYFKTKAPAVSSENGDGTKGDEHILEIPLVTHIEKLEEEVKMETVKPSLSVNFENKVNDASAEQPLSKETEMDDLSKISKFLTDEINNLTNEHKTTNIEKTNVEIMQVEDLNEKNKTEEEPEKMMEIKIAHDVDSKADNENSDKSLASNLNQKSEKRLNESDIDSQNSDETSSINSNEQEEPAENITSQATEQENSENQNGKKEYEKEEVSVETDQQENAVENTKTSSKIQSLDDKKEHEKAEEISVETGQQANTAEDSKRAIKSQFLENKKENEKEEVSVETDQQENTAQKSKRAIKSQSLDNKKEHEKEEVSVETDQQESTAEKAKPIVKSQFLDNKKENEKEEVSVEIDQQESTAEKSKTTAKSQSDDDKKEDKKELDHNETDQQENTVEKSKTTTKSQALDDLNVDTLVSNKEVCDIDKSNFNSVPKKKDEKSFEISDQDNITNNSNNDISSTSDFNNTENFNCNELQEVDGLKPENQTASSPSLVTHFCAEFLAGLPNEPSSALTNVSNNENDASRNDIDFEFENNCSTPTMCRFDLDSMTENTSDIPNVMSGTQLTSEACEADKLLEDFNHKTEDIVDTALSKKTNQSNSTEVSVRHTIQNDQNTLISTHSHEALKRSHENEDNLDNTEEQTHKKFITTTTRNEHSQEMEKAVEKQETECVTKKCLQHENKQAGSKQVVVANCCQLDQEIRENSKPHNQANKRIKLENNQSEIIPPQLDSFADTSSNDSLHKMEFKTQKPLKSNRKSKHNHENYHGAPLKKMKKSHKQQINTEAKIQSPKRKTSEDCKKSDDLTESVSCTSSIMEKLENNTISEREISKQMEASINDSEHMTLELGNWKQDTQNENKPNNSESGGVSAIFSFPKIPIISISICTTPNNKTYFKISKRGNDDTQSKEVVKTKQQEVNVNESKNNDQLVKTVSEDLSCNEKNNLTSDSAEVKKGDPLAEEDQTTEHNVEEEDEDYEEEEEEEETETDNIEIEKFSHDSNSACSLPLKKRPTQSEPNDETEDSESTDVINSEQPEEIAAEVVIENSDKDKQMFEHNSTEIEQILSENEEERNRESIETTLKNIVPDVSNIDDNAFMLNDFDDNKPSTSAACFKKLNDPSSPFKRRVNNSIRPIGQPPVQIVTPQLKDNSPSPSQDCRTADPQVPNAPRLLTNTQPLPESYPATPMLSVANVEKLMDLNRFIEDLLASPDVMTIIDNANACGYYAEGQAYEMERIAILEHYNIANAKGNTSVTKPLYWKKSAGDTISIFNDNDNEWIALPPSTAKQLLKLSFVLSILQQQYKVSDVRQRINIALTFLIQTSCSSKFKSNTNTSSLQQRMQVYSRTISDVNINNNNNNNIPQPLPSTSYFRIATNNDALNTSFNINSNIDTAQDLQTNNYSNAQHQQTDSVSMPQEHTNNTGSQTWNNIVQFGHGTDQMASSSGTHHINANSTENEQQQQTQQDKRNTTWDELTNDQLYINPPCATSPQNEVIVNTNGVQLHEMPQNYQDQQNIFISITDESGPTIGGSADSTHKYNTRQQQQHQQQRTLDEREHIPAPSSTSPTTQSYNTRQYLGSSNAASLIQNSLSNNVKNRNNIITVFGSQEINLQNPYRMQQNFQQQQQQQQQQLQSQTSKLLNTTSPPGTSFQQQQQQGNMSSQNLPINMNKNVRALNALTQQKPQQRMSTRYTTNFNSQQQQQQQQQQQTAIQLQNSQTKVNESNYKEILQPYITYLIKDHEKTSKHLLQVFEEVSNSNSSSTTNINTNNLTAQQQQQFNTILPPLIRNPQQNHMPGFHLMPGDRNMDGILPSLIRNPNQTINITNRDSGALQVVQSFLDQSQTECQQQQQEKDLSETSSTFLNPGFAKEYVNFVGSRDEVVYKQKLHKFNAVQQEYQQEEQRQDHLIQEAERLNYVKRKCQERNDKLAEDLKRKIMEFSQLKHNVQIKLLEKQQKEEGNIKRRGRPKKKLPTAADSVASPEGKQRQTNAVNRNKRKQVNTDLPSGSTTMDHAYFRQRTAAREAAKKHLAAAPTLFRNILGCSYPAPFSPSSSSVSSRSLTSPATPVTPTKTRKKSRVPKTQKSSSVKKRRPTVGSLDDMKNNDGELNSEGEYSIIRSRESLKDVYNSSGQLERTSFTGKDDSRFRESSDDYYGATSDTDIIKNDAKLRNRCTVVIKPTKELLQYERRRDELYNEILQKQRRKLELRALEKQREKERRRLSRRDENGDSDIPSEGVEKGLPTLADKRDARRRSPRNHSDICMSSESEIETNFQVRSRKQKQQQQHVKEIQPLASLLNEIDTYLDKPAKEVHEQKIQEPNQYVQDKNNDDVHASAGVNITENGKQQLCDINTDTGQTKMRELNLLADIAQHLSPYQLDLPECNKPPQSSSSSPPSPLPPTQTPSPPLPIERSINTLENSMENKDAESKGKAIVTEQLIIQSFDNLLEKSQQIDKNDKLQPQQSQQNPKENLQQEDIHDYAHEPKLNVAAIFNSSPASLLKDQNQQQNNTPVKDADVNPSNNKTNNSTSLEQILEESIKSVTSPFNPNNNECNASKTTQPQPENESKIPLLISNVESLNHLQHNSLTGDITSKSDGGDSDDAKNSKQNLNERKSNQFNSENVFFMNKTTTNETKDVTEENTTSDNTTSRLISTVESSIICGDLSNMSSGMEMTNNTQVTTLMPADLSDISLESELSKHLPEIAEPSPVVTDMSDNSNESDVSKSFVINSTHHQSNDIPVMSLPDLPLVMPPIPPPPPLPPSQQAAILNSSSTTPQLEHDYNPLDATLNTPIKQPPLPTEDVCSAQSRGDLVTPLKFALQTDLESDNSPLKSSLEPENDSNVTKFLDLILNKTVTDAESEARDKIIKELNALTADTSATESVENIQKDDTETGSKTLHSNPTEDDADADKNKNKVQNHVEEIKSLDAADKDKLSKDEKVSKSKSKKFSMKDDYQNSFEENFETNHKQFDKPTHDDESIKKDTETSVERNEKQEQAHKKDILIPEIPEIFPPKVNSLKESTTSSINTELISTTTPNSETSNAKLKISPVKQTFNIKCRVRLKRLNITEHCKSSKKETWMAIPITKPEESETASNDPTNCDNSKNDATTLLKKPCLKYNSNRAEDVLERKFSENFVEVTEPIATKKPKLEVVEQKPLEAIQTQTPSQQETTNLLTANTSNHGVAFSNNVGLSTKSKSKNSKTVTFDLSNLNDELKDTTCGHKQKSKGHTSSPTAGGIGYYHKNTRHPRKLPDNTLRAAETLQIFVNTINDCARTPPPAEFNRKRSPIKNKCIAEDETPRPPLASTLLGTQSCKKVCPEKSRTQITSSKLKDQLVSSLATPSISNITSDITTARIYTSSPLDQTLPEYDVDNVDTVADSELILPTTTGSLRRKLKRPKKSLARPEPVDDISTDDISNQPECNGDDDTDAVVDNEDDVFVEELLPIPAANEHILEEIVSGRPTHIGTGTVIRDDYMNIEATATVPVYLFNDESRDLATPEPIQSSDANVVDSSSYLNTPSTANAPANASATTTSTIGNLEKSMLSPSEHEVSSTQETFYQTPTKSKQIDAFGDKSMANKDKSSGSLNAINNQMKNDDKTFQNKEDHPTSYSSGLLQNNQVDTTNHSPEMCSLTLGSTTTTTTTMTNNRKMRKASTHDEILFNELQQQQQQQQQQHVQLQQQQQQQQSQQKSLQQNKRKTTMFCAQSTSDNGGNVVKNKLVTSNSDDLKTNGSLGRIEDKFKKLLKDGANKRDKTQLCNDGSSELCAVGGGAGGGGGSSPSTTTIIIEEKPSKSKRKKLKSSKSEKNKHSERSTKIVLKASKLAAHVPDNPLKITIPKSRLIRPPPTPTPPTPNDDLHDRDTNSFYNNNVEKIAKDKDKSFAVHNHCTTQIETADSEMNCSGKARLLSGVIDTKSIVVDSEKGKVVLNANTSIVTNDKEKITNNTLSTKRKNKTTHNTDNLTASLTITPTTNNNSNSNSTTITTNCLNKNNNNNSNNSIFVRDKYDLIKSKEKHHHHLQENKEKSKDKDKLNSEVKKHDNHNKSSSTSATNRHHNKNSAKEKNRKKDKEKHKNMDKTFTAQHNILKSITQKTTSSNLNTMTTLTLSPSTIVATSKSSKTKLQDIANGSTSLATTQVLKSKTNLSTSQTSLSSSAAAAGLTTQISTSSSASMSPSSVTISTNHVRKKLKTK